jgi:hypothetical protein
LAPSKLLRQRTFVVHSGSAALVLVLGFWQQFVVTKASLLGGLQGVGARCVEEEVLRLQLHARQMFRLLAGAACGLAYLRLGHSSIPITSTA